MILGDLFESRMSDLDIQYQDWKNMSPVAFLSRYKMSKEAWYNKHQSLVPAEGSVQEDSHRFKGPHGVVDVDQSKPGVTKVTRHSDVGAKSFSNKDQNRSIGTGVKTGSGVSDTQGTRRTFPRLNIDGPELSEATNELSIGDPVIIQGTEYDGKTGEIGEFSPSGKFVVVDLYNYGSQAFNLANVKYNEYADEEQFDEEKVRLDPKCWTGKKIGNPKTKMKGGVRVNNCVPK